MDKKYRKRSLKLKKCEAFLFTKTFKILKAFFFLVLLIAERTLSQMSWSTIALWTTGKAVFRVALRTSVHISWSTISLWTS